MKRSNIFLTGIPQCPTLKFLSAFFVLVLLRFTEGKATSWPSFGSVKEKNRISVKNSGQQELARSESIGIKEEERRTEDVEKNMPTPRLQDQQIDVHYSFNFKASIYFVPATKLETQR